LLANKYLLKKLGASLFFIKNLLKISLFGKERKFKGPKKFTSFSARICNLGPNFLSLPKRENSWREISQI